MSRRMVLNWGRGGNLKKVKIKIEGEEGRERKLTDFERDVCGGNRFREDGL